MGVSFNTQMINGNTHNVLKRKINAFTKGKTTNSKEQHQWNWYMNFIKWLAHSVVFENDNNNVFKKFKDAIAHDLFWSGTSCLAKIGGEWVRVGIKDTKYDSANMVKSAVVADINGAGVSKTLAKPVEAGVTGAFFQMNFYQIPLITELDVYLNPILDLWELIPDELQNAITTIVAKATWGNEGERDTLLKEVEELFRKKKSNLVQLLPANNVVDYQEVKTTSISAELQEAMKFYINYMFRMTGRLYNASEKRERNIVSEVAINEIQFDIVLDDYFFYLQKAVDDINKIDGSHITIKSLKDVIDEKQMELQAVNMLHQPQQEGKQNDDSE